MDSRLFFSIGKPIGSSSPGGVLGASNLSSSSRIPSQGMLLKRSLRQGIGKKLFGVERDDRMR